MQRLRSCCLYNQLWIPAHVFTIGFPSKQVAYGYRWMDNDMYGHVNNTVYYAYFDTVINHFLINRGGLNPTKSASIGFCVESQCSFKAPLEYPDIVEAGLYVSKIGKSSVTYEIGIFKKGDPMLKANGHFVHVFVDSETRKPKQIPADILSALTSILSTSKL